MVKIKMSLTIVFSEQYLLPNQYIKKNLSIPGKSPSFSKIALFLRIRSRCSSGVYKRLFLLSYLLSRSSEGIPKIELNLAGRDSVGDRNPLGEQVSAVWRPTIKWEGDVFSQSESKEKRCALDETGQKICLFISLFSHEYWLSTSNFVHSLAPSGPWDAWDARLKGINGLPLPLFLVNLR